MTTNDSQPEVLLQQGNLDNIPTSTPIPSNTPPTSVATPLTPDGLILLNPSHFPEKLDGSNYLVWRDQILDLLFGSHLDQFISVDATPPPTSDVDGHLRWTRQDRLIRHALVASLNSTCKPLIGSARTSAAVWKTLEELYGTRSPSQIRNMKDTFRHYRQGSQPVGAYLHHLRTLANELAQAGHPVDEEDFVVQALEGLRPEFASFANSIRTCSDHNFKTIHTLLTGFEDSLKRKEEEVNSSVVVATANNVSTGESAALVARRDSVPSILGPGPLAQFQQQSNLVNYSARNTNRNQPRNQRPNTNYNPNRRGNNNSGGPTRNQAARNSSGIGNFGPNVTCQICGKPNHSAINCWHRFEQQAYSPQVNTAVTRHNGWLLDSGATNHVTNNLNNLTLASDYTGTDSLVIGNGKGSANGSNFVTGYE